MSVVSVHFPAALLALALASAPCNGAEVKVPDDYPSIGEALNAIVADPDLADTVLVEPGTYEERIVLPHGVILQGRETARTLLAGTGAGPIVTAPGTVAARISNFTFLSGEGDTAIAVSAGSNLHISNNVFALGPDSTAIWVEGFSAPRVVNNTFYDNGVAVNTGGNVLVIENNAFVANVETLFPAPFDATSIAHNGYADNASTAIFGRNAVTGAPAFVASAERDFHLRAGSAYIDAGTGTDALDDTPADIGAYGGEHADGRPMPVAGVRVSATTENSITVTWSGNPWYRLGGYRLWYDHDRSGPPYTGSDAAGGPSPIDVGNVTTYTLEELTPPLSALEAPVLEAPEPRHQALKLAWSAVANAQGYTVHYGVGSVDEHTRDVGNVTEYLLSGLENGTTYRISVSAYGRSRYFIAVSAYASFADSPESRLSEEVSTAIGARIESLPSNQVSDFPEPVVPFPDLPDKSGCLIATAAYGAYNAAEVQLLRRFRDRYLLFHPPGRAFVGWYYRHSPAWVRTLERHPWAKPAVRLAIQPLVWVARFALNTSVAQKLAVLLLLAGFYAKRPTVRRGQVA